MYSAGFGNQDEAGPFFSRSIYVVFVVSACLRRGMEGTKQLRRVARPDGAGVHRTRAAALAGNYLRWDRDRV
jgi:hypothetical protein